MSELLSTFLASIGFDNLLQKIGVTQISTKETVSPSQIVGYIAFAIVFLFATIESLNLIGFETLGTIVSQFTFFGGKVLLGLFVLSFGLYIAKLVSGTVKKSASPNSEILASASYLSIVILAGTMALQQMGIADEIVSIAFGLTLGGCAIAFGISFGLGGKETASKIIADIYKKFK